MGRGYNFQIFIPAIAPSFLHVSGRNPSDSGFLAHDRDKQKLTSVIAGGRKQTFVDICPVLADCFHAGYRFLSST
jgi:hypothetical protein